MDRSERQKLGVQKWVKAGGRGISLDNGGGYLLKII